MAVELFIVVMSIQPEQGVAYQIERATWRDLASLRRLEQETFELDAWPLIDLLAVLIMPGIVRYKAVSQGEMIGFVGGERRNENSVGWVITLAVSAPYRRKGVARTLLHVCEQALGTRRLRLSVRQSNQAAIRLYQSEDYIQVDTWKRYYSGGEDALILEKIHPLLERAAD